MDALKYTFLVRYAYVSLPLLRVLPSQPFLFSLDRPFGFIMCKATTMHSGRIIAHLGPGKADSKKMVGKVSVYIFITRTRFSVAIHVVSFVHLSRGVTFCQIALFTHVLQHCQYF